MLNATYEVFHTDTGNHLRNKVYDEILNRVSFLPKLNSPTYYLNTFDKVDEFTKDNPGFKVQTLEKYDANGKTFPSNSGICGIWASNYIAYKNFLNSDKEILIVFEDDVEISPNFKTVAKTYMKELPDDWEVFSFYVPNDSLFAYNSAAHDVPGANFICKSYQQWAMCGYAVNRKSAQKIVDDIETKGIEAPIDWYLFNFRMHPRFLNITFNTYTVKPQAYRPLKLVPQVADVSTVLTMDQRD